MITWKLPVYKFALERKEKIKSLPSLTHFLANWMITISDFFPSVFHSFFTSEENVFFTSEGNFVYPTISPCTIHLSVFFYDTQCKTCSTTKNFVAVNKKKQVIDTWFYSLLLFEFLLSRLFCSTFKSFLGFVNRVQPSRDGFFVCI